MVFRFAPRLRSLLFLRSTPGRLAGLLVLLLLVAALPSRAQVLDVRPDAAAPGQVLRLYGPGLTGSLDAVTIGGQVAPIVDDANPDRILVEVPSTTGGPAPVELQRTSGGPLGGSELFTVVTGGPGTFTAGEDLFSDTDNQSSPYTLDVGDIDGDGSLDVLAGFLQNGTVAWFPNDGSGTQNTVTSGFNYPRAVLLADVVDDQDGNGPGDGDPDIIAVAGANNASSDGDDKIRVFPNQGNGSFGGQDIVGSSFVDDVRDVAAGDLDGDGDVDLVSVSQDNGRVVLHLNENNSSSFVHSTPATLNDPRAIELADVDRDGLLDLLVAEHGSGGNLTLFRNAGGGSFDDGQQVLSDLSNPIDLTVADFNGSGAMGVAVAVSGAGSVLILPNEGGTLAATPLVQSGLGTVRAVHAADLTGDGRPDLLTSNEATGEAVWFRNEGGSFQIEDPISTSPASRSDIQAADLDADGDLDPIYASNGPDAVTLYRNDTGTPTISGFPGDQTIDEDGTTGPLSFTVSDPEDSALTADPSSSNQALVPNSNITVSGPDTDGNTTIEVVPLPDANSAPPTGTATISLSIEDEDGNVQSGSFELTVNPVNDAPVADDDSYTTDEDRTLSVSAPGLLGNDTDVDAGETLTVSPTPVTAPSDGSVTLNADGSFSYTPAADFNGTDSFTYEITDGSGAAAQASVSLTVTAVNDAPTITPISDQTIDEDGSLQLTDLQVGDAELSPTDLLIDVTSSNPDLVPSADATVTAPGTDGLVDLSVVPRPDSNSAAPTGTTTITVSLDDGTTTSTEAFDLTVTPVNDAPTIGAVSNQTINEDESTGPVPVSLSDIDTEPASLNLSASSNAPSVIPDSNLVLDGTGADRTVTATPLPNSNGTATVTLSVSDGSLSATTSFTVDVLPVDDPPTVSAAEATEITSTSATLTGTVTPLDDATDVSFILEPTDGSTAPQTLSAGTSLTGSDPLSVQASATGIQPDTEYRVVLEATSSIGTTTKEFFFSTINPLSLSPENLAFAPLGVDSRRSRTITVANNRATGADITRIDVTGADAAVFSIVDGPAVPFTLPSGADTTLRVAYAPTTAAGSQSASLAIETSLEVETAPLAGTAEPRYQLPVGRIPVEETARSFVGYSNPLPEPVTVTDAVFTGPDADRFSLPSGLVGRQFESGEVAQVPITIRSPEPGPLATTLTIATTAGEFVVDLSARALAVTARVADGQIPVVGSSVPVRVDIPPALSPSQATLYYRPTGTEDFDRRSFDVASGGSATVSIPGSAVPTAGTQYYVEIVDRQEQEPLRITAPAGAPDRDLATVAPQIEQIASRGTVRPRQYRMYSVPVEADTSLEAVLTAPYNFGGYNRSEWRAFRHPPSLGALQSGRPPEQIRLQEFPDIDGMGEPGTAFWHVAQSDRRLRVRGASAPDASTPQAVTLAPGWNQIGTPFPFAVDWQAVLDTTRSQMADSTARAALDRVSAPVAWTGRQYRFDVATLRPWRGYFVFNPNPDRPIDLKVPPVRSAATAGTSAQGRALKATSTPSSPSSSASTASTRPFRLQLRARVRVDGLDRTLTDAANWIGVLPDAQNGIGPEDRPEPPPVGDYVRLSVLGADAPGRYRATSFKAPTPDGHTWSVEVAAQVRERFFTDKSVTVTLDGRDRLPDAFRVYVLDMEERRLLPQKNGSVRVPLTEDTPRRRLRVIVGTESYAAQNNAGVPLESFDYALKGNYPNPLDGETRIAYTLKKESRVQLTIYDLLGRRIRTLVDGSMQKTGPHEVVWDGRNAFGAPVASGVYVYRIEAGSFSATGKMTVVR